MPSQGSVCSRVDTARARSSLALFTCLQVMCTTSANTKNNKLITYKVSSFLIDLVHFLFIIQFCPFISCTRCTHTHRHKQPCTHFAQSGYNNSFLIIIRAVKLCQISEKCAYLYTFLDFH